MGEVMVDMAATITLPRATRAAMATDWEPRPSAPTTGTGQATPLTTSSRTLSTTAVIIIICTSVAMMTMADTAVAMARAMDMATIPRLPLQPVLQQLQVLPV